VTKYNCSTLTWEEKQKVKTIYDKTKDELLNDFLTANPKMNATVFKKYKEYAESIDAFLAKEKRNPMMENNDDG